MSRTPVFMLLALCCVALLALGCKPTAPNANGNGTGNGTGNGNGNGGDGAKPIKIGVVLPMTGGISTYGEECWAGVKMAVPADYKVQGRPVEFVNYDNASTPEGTLARVRDAVDRDGCLALIGSVASSNTLKGAGLANPAKCPMITPASTNVDVTKVGEYIFRVCYTDLQQGPICAKFALHEAKARGHENPVVVTITDMGQDYCKGLRDAFLDHWRANGGGTVHAVTYTGGSEGDADFTAQVTATADFNPHVIFIPGYYPDVAAMLKLGRESWKNILIVGGDGWDSPDLISIAGAETFNELECYQSGHYAVDDPNEVVQNFVQTYRENMGKQPGSMAALGYDSVKMILQVLEGIEGEITREAIRAGLLKVKDFKGVTGNISIGADRNADKKIVMLKCTPDAFLREGVYQPPQS